MNEVIRIPLSQGYEALIDAADLPLVQGRKWHIVSSKSPIKYARCWGIGNMLMHRLLSGVPRGLDVDHLDGDGLNNTRSNLRVVSRSENCKNRSTGQGKTGVLNVYFRNGRYEVVLRVDGKHRRFGRFSTLHEAAIAAYEARLKHYGPEAVARIPDPRQEVAR